MTSKLIYYNDARHYYLYVFEPPMSMEDAWKPVDEVLGTSVTTLSYGVEREDGIFYPSKKTVQFGADRRPFKGESLEWRAWKNMKSLEAKGLDPLQVLIDRSHDKGLEFMASLRMANWGGLDKSLKIDMPEGRANYSNKEVRQHILGVLSELANDYDIDSLEMDFAFVPYYFHPDEAKENVDIMTELVESVREMVSKSNNKNLQLGARILPTEETNLNGGLDPRTWIKSGLVDFVMPMWYQVFELDPDMPLDWVIQLSENTDVEIYGMLMPYKIQEGRRSLFGQWLNASPEMMNAAALNFYNKGVDGLCTWFMKWPLGDNERSTLSNIGDRELLKYSNKHYIVRRNEEGGDPEYNKHGMSASNLGYTSSLPLELKYDELGQSKEVQFYLSDDFESSFEILNQVTLKLQIRDIVSEDELVIKLNGKSLNGQPCVREYANVTSPYQGQWLNFDLMGLKPVKGENVLELTLVSRPDELEGDILLEDVELIVQYGSYPSRL